MVYKQHHDDRLLKPGSKIICRPLPEIRRMKAYTNLKRFPFYLWVSLSWLLLWTFVAYIHNPPTFGQQLLNETWFIIYIVVINYIFFEYSLPLILKKRPYILFTILFGFLLITIQLILVSFGLYGWKTLGMQLDIFTSFRHVTLIPDNPYNLMMEDVFYQAKTGIMSLFYFGIIKNVSDYRNLIVATQQLRIEKQQAELNYLKSQTNPHFLFNTLNNIYSLARDKSDLTPESILRLSKILRFMLYETGGAFIRTEQELEIIADYIALEKLRYDDSLRITFTHEIEDMKQPLPPLLLIPLVENAFKHGISETSNHPFVDIHFLTSQQQLTFVVTNSTPPIPEQKSVTENIGLSNLRRQLELLYTDFHLSVQQDDTLFTATLKINLASHV